MDEEKKQELNLAIAVIRNYCKNTECEDCVFQKRKFCGHWDKCPSKWPTID